eukprot:2860879-Karenia_brevis.AAC.1
MTMVNKPYLTLHSARICICAALGRGAHRNDSGKQTLPDTTIYSERICICAAPWRDAHRNDIGTQTVPDSTL